MKKLFPLFLILALVVCVIPAAASSYDDEFVIEDQYETELGGDPVDQTPAESHAIYQSLYSMLHTHIFGGAELTPEMTLTLVQLSTFFCLVMIFIPFIPFIWLLKRWF